MEASPSPYSSPDSSIMPSVWVMDSISRPADAANSAGITVMLGRSRSASQPTLALDATCETATTV